MNDMTVEFLHHQFHHASTMDPSALVMETASTTLANVNLNLLLTLKELLVKSSLNHHQELANL
jgi:hypothetical protein